MINTNIILSKLGKFIIFLDVDGVFVSYDNLKERDSSGEQIFLENAVKSFNYIADFYQADVCMVSGWNPKFTGLGEGAAEDAYKKFLEKRGFVFPGNLYIGDQANRYEFVRKQIKAGLKDYLCIDDECYGYYELMPTVEFKRILQTNSYRCLDEFDALKVTRLYKLKSLTL